MAAPDDAAMMPLGQASIPFIVSSNDGRVDAATRKFIRSYAMRGRKQSRIRRKRNVLVYGYDMAAGSVQAPSVNFEDIMRLYAPPMRRIGTDLSFLAPPEDLDLSILSNIIKGAEQSYLVLTAADGHTVCSLTYSAEDCASAHDGGRQPSGQSWMDPSMYNGRCCPPCYCVLRGRLHRRVSSPTRAG